VFDNQLNSKSNGNIYEIFILATTSLDINICVFEVLDCF
jgi:hypothetical protein